MSLDLELIDFKEEKSISKKLELNENPHYLTNNMFQLYGYRLAFKTCDISDLFEYNNKERPKIIHGKTIGEKTNGSLGGIIVITFFAAIFSISFYASLIYAIKEKLIFFALLIISLLVLSSLFNYKLIPLYLKNIDIKHNFSEFIEKLLNTQVSITTINGTNIDYKYIYDITGKINIPKNYKFISIQNFQFFVDKDMQMIRDKCCFIDGEKQFSYRNIKIGFSNQDRDEKLKFSERDFDHNDNSNFGDRRVVFALDNYDFNIIINISYVLMVFQVLWLFIIYMILNHYAECIDIYPAKYLTQNPAKIQKTQIIIHGKLFEQKNAVNMLRNENDLEILEEMYNKTKKRIKKKKEEKELQLKRKEEKKKELEMNTEVLSRWANSNYLIEVYREFDNVKLLLRVREYGKEDLEKRFKLGVYNDSIDEKVEDMGLTSVFTPRGFDIKIKVTNFERNYNIKIGNGIFDRSFRYN